MRTINEPPLPIDPVRVEFYWTHSGKITPFIVNGITYPYKHQADEEPPNPTKGGRASDSRYTVFTTGLNNPVTFDAIDSESEGHPKVIVPKGVNILQYLWRFGDGIEVVGPVVSHKFIVNDPFTTVKLTVTDSRGIRWTALKELNLLFTFASRLVANKIIV